jgi:CheY-like chemotaxis protein
LDFYFWEEAGYKIFLEMLIKEGEYETVARRFIEKARVGRKMKEEDSARLAELSDMIVSGDYRQRRTALLELESNHGEYAIGYLYRELENDNVEARVNVIAALFRMGEEVTLPLIQVLEADSGVVKRNAAVVLGRIRDARSVPALKMLTEDPVADGTVKDAAADAIAGITGQDAGSLDSASILFCNMAESYLLGDDAICKPFLKSSVIWQWSEGALSYRPVLPGLRNLELAEESCYKALACDSGNIKAVTLLAAVYASQLAEINSMGSDDEDEGVTFARESLAKADAVLALCGPDRMQEALSFVLANGLNLAALEIITAMEKTGNFSEQALEEASGSKDKLVRYAAAFAAVRSGLVDQDVVWTVAKALGETSVRQVLVVDDNPETLNALLTGLNENGYFAVGAGSGAEGLSRAKAYPPKDLIVVKAGLKDLTVDSIVYELASGPSADTPVLMLGQENEMENLKGVWEGKVAGFLTTFEVLGGNYLPVVQDSVGELNDSRQKALELSAKAAETLALLDGAVLADVVDDLNQALQKSDEVRLPVLKALAKVGNRTSLEPVGGVFADTSAASEVRVAAARTLGAIFAAGDAAPDGDVMAALQEALNGDDAALRLAAAEALGKAVELAGGDMKAILEANRIQ